MTVCPVPTLRAVNERHPKTRSMLQRRVSFVPPRLTKRKGKLLGSWQFLSSPAIPLDPATVDLGDCFEFIVEMQVDQEFSRIVLGMPSSERDSCEGRLRGTCRILMPQSRYEKKYCSLARGIILP